MSTGRTLTSDNFLDSRPIVALPEFSTQRNSTDDLLNGKLEERKQNGEAIRGNWVLKTYVTLLREHAFLCGHPIWTDTGTKDWCFKSHVRHEPITRIRCRFFIFPGDVTQP